MVVHWTHKYIFPKSKPERTAKSCNAFLARNMCWILYPIKQKRPMLHRLSDKKQNNLIVCYFIVFISDHMAIQIDDWINVAAVYITMFSICHYIHACHISDRTNQCIISANNPLKYICCWWILFLINFKWTIMVINDQLIGLNCSPKIIHGLYWFH